MRAPTSWLAELVGMDVPPSGEQVAADLVRVGLEEEALHAGEVSGPLVVGRVLDKTDEPQKNGKTIHFCHVDVGRAEPQEIVCGAHNFEPGDLVVVILPGGRLGDFEIGARKTYGHMSAGMICSERELGLGDDHDGIIVLTEYFFGDPVTVASLTPGQDALPLLGLDEEVVEVNVTPDRGYCFSMRGIAREYALSTGRAGAFRDPVGPDVVQEPMATDAGYPVRLIDEGRIHGVAGCDRYVARVARGVDATAPTPRWMKRRLTQMGMRPVNVVVDVTNYVMLLTGQPLHAFDVAALSSSLEVRRARAGETLTTLDGVDRVLDPEDLLITDGGVTPLAIAGVMGGAECEVSDETRDILIESAHFDPVSVARSSRRHKLSTEASRRFERGVDPQIAGAVAELAVRLVVELAGGQVEVEVTDVDRRTPRTAITFDPGLVWQLTEPGYRSTGPAPAGLSHDDVVAALVSLGCAVEEITDHQGEGFAPVRVMPPSWRPDLSTGPDLVEEVARLRGYDCIPSVLPTAPGGRGLTREQRGMRLVGSTLAGLGFTEVWSYPFISPAVFDACGFSEHDERRRVVRLANPLSEEAPCLRTSVLDSLLATVRLNVRRGAKDVALYETGLVFLPKENAASAPVPQVGVRPEDTVLRLMAEAIPSQPRRVAWAACGDASSEGPWGQARPWSASDVIAAAVSMGQVFGVPLQVAAAPERAPWHPGRAACVRTEDGVVVGYAGEVHPKVCLALDLPARTCAAELDLELLWAAVGGPVQAGALSTYPVAHTDVALVVPESVPAAEVAQALRDGAGDDLEDVVLFDVFRGDQIGSGLKSLAYRLSFRAANRTLTTAEVSTARDAAIAVAAQRMDAVQRV
ncbi:Phenylalanine--tRNA ligase beta subunit [Austwickia sp. TVS 96-490-7B]|uniref:phenylalanine--tRNA ligase subunit beta n=1 Tax=Austwickia sp. TVS 96-490-7B TaxID=2830843 RepID=UPI001C58B1DA|nr:phenylalanine--tRNA ligase subunit beta [Austwickia sp. TVS 96-490-7B]MBW3084373.1 Phenylalanine--tRNA ligase beta subunit [Austwickia sp. TVS 96-490-7B]